MYRAVLSAHILIGIRRQQGGAHGQKRRADRAVFSADFYGFRFLIRQLHRHGQMSAFSHKLFGGKFFSVQCVADLRGYRRLGICFTPIVEICFFCVPNQFSVPENRLGIAFQIFNFLKTAFIPHIVKTVVTVQPVADDLLLYGAVLIQNNISGFVFLHWYGPCGNRRSRAG